MRKISLAVACLLTVSSTAVPAQQVPNFFYPAPHAYRPPYTYKHGSLPRGWRWVVIPPIAYAPISPQDYSIPNSETYMRLWAPYPYCCPFPLYSPEYRP